MTFLYSVVLIILYIITEIVYASTKQTSPWICTLYHFGGKFTYAIARKGHIHRLLLPIILHSGFLHLFWNLVSLYMIGFSIEKAFGKWYKFLALIVLGGIGGNIFSATIGAYNVSVGASTSLFAIIGAVVVWFYRYWDVLGPVKFQNAIFLGIMILFAFLNGFLAPSSGIDNWGHLGGLIYGLMLTPLLLPSIPIEGQSQELMMHQAVKERRIRVVAIACLILVTVVFIIALFARPLPGCANGGCEIC